MITKRQLGLIFLMVGIMATIAILVAELMGAGKFQGIGPLQRIALSLTAALSLVGISLIPLGDRPA
jgi:Na+-driven multidrug efflux pump